MIHWFVYLHLTSIVTHDYPFTSEGKQGYGLHNTPEIVYNTIVDLEESLRAGILSQTNITSMIRFFTTYKYISSHQHLTLVFNYLST